MGLGAMNSMKYAIEIAIGTARSTPMPAISREPQSIGPTCITIGWTEVFHSEPKMKSTSPWLSKAGQALTDKKTRTRRTITTAEYAAMLAIPKKTLSAVENGLERSFLGDVFSEDMCKMFLEVG
jgi:hypothetical protein